MAHGAEQQKLAVDSGDWPLYRFDPRRSPGASRRCSSTPAPPKVDRRATTCATRPASAWSRSRTPSASKQLVAGAGERRPSGSASTSSWRSIVVPPTATIRRRRPRGHRRRRAWISPPSIWASSSRIPSCPAPRRWWTTWTRSAALEDAGAAGHRHALAVRGADHAARNCPRSCATEQYRESYAEATSVLPRRRRTSCWARTNTWSRSGGIKAAREGPGHRFAERDHGGRLARLTPG